MNTQRMPGIGVVARAQLELLVRTKYAVGLLGYVMLIVLGTYWWMPRFETIPPWEGPWIMVLYGGLAGSGAIAGLIVWFNEGPQKRRYHWAMPVSRDLHDLARIGAGAAWLMFFAAVACLIAWLLEAPVTRAYWLRAAPIFWASLFLVPLLSYLLIMIPCLMFKRPLLPILAVSITCAVVSLESVALKYPALGDIGDALLSWKQPPSLGTALGGGLLTAPWSDPAARQRVYRAVSGDFWKETGAPPSVKQRTDLAMQSTVFPPPLVTTREWLGALALWYVIAVLGIVLAIRRRPDV